MDEGVPTADLAGGHHLRARRLGEPVDGAGLGVVREVDDALSGAQDVLRGLALGGQAEDAAVAEPEDGGGGREVEGAVLVLGGDDGDGGAPVEDGGVDG